jgi:hypothetical protein
MGERVHELLTGPWAAGAALMLSASVAGMLVYRWHRRQAALRSMSAPSQWPILARELVTPEEYALWQWLCEVFADYPVMIKLPLLRFVALSTAADSAVWHKRLGGVYCTFTVCSAGGTVIGCLDYVGEDDDRAHCYLKESILGKCGIAYVMASPGRLPTAESLRAAFIGEIELSGPDMTGPGILDPVADSAGPELTAGEPQPASPVDSARSNLQSSLEHGRQQRGIPPSGMPGAPG